MFAMAVELGAGEEVIDHVTAQLHSAATSIDAHSIAV